MSGNSRRNLDFAYDSGHLSVRSFHSSDSFVLCQIHEAERERCRLSSLFVISSLNARRRRKTVIHTSIHSAPCEGTFRAWRILIFPASPRSRFSLFQHPARKHRLSPNIDNLVTNMLQKPSNRDRSRPIFEMCRVPHSASGPAVDRAR